VTPLLHSSVNKPTVAEVGFEESSVRDSRLFANTSSVTIWDAGLSDDRKGATRNPTLPKTVSRRKKT